MRAHATLRLESSGKASQQRGLWTVLHVTDVSLVQGVRLQMVWDNLSCLGTEALARLG